MFCFYIQSTAGPLVPRPQAAVAIPQTSGMVAPVSGDNNMGIRRAEIKQGIREVVLCKDGSGKVGLRVRAINKGVFVQYVHANSPASLGGLRFGDQILQIDGETLAGYSGDKVMKILKNASAQRIVFALRDRWEVPYDFKASISHSSLPSCEIEKNNVIKLLDVIFPQAIWANNCYAEG